jgi:hypothetical protein
MDEYIFYTAEGHCETPRGDEVYNYQILGFAEGRSEWEAKSKLLRKVPGLKRQVIIPGRFAALRW